MSRCVWAAVEKARRCNGLVLKALTADFFFHDDSSCVVKMRECLDSNILRCVCVCAWCLRAHGKNRNMPYCNPERRKNPQAKDTDYSLVPVHSVNACGNSSKREKREESALASTVLSCRKNGTV